MILRQFLKEIRREERDVIEIHAAFEAGDAGADRLDIGGQREALVRALGRLAKACGTHIRVVFDGDSGGAPPVTTPLPVRVVFTKAGVEADDDIIDAEIVDDEK